MIDADDPISRKYGVIIARKLYDKFPNLMKHASSSSDSDIHRFAEDEIQRENLYSSYYTHQIIKKSSQLKFNSYS